MNYKKLSLQIIFIILCLCGVAYALFHQIYQQCPKWLLNREVTLVIELIKDPLISLGVKGDALFSIAGTLLVFIMLFSMLFFFTFFDILYELISDYAKRLSTFMFNKGGKDVRY